MSEIWAAAAAVIGAGAAVYGTVQQKKANAKAQDMNLAAQSNQNDSAWSNYLFSRGVAPTAPVQPGVLPSAGQYKAVNTRLPIWMTLQTPPKPAAKKGGFLIPRA